MYMLRKDSCKWWHDMLSFHEGDKNAIKLNRKLSQTKAMQLSVEIRKYQEQKYVVIKGTEYAGYTRGSKNNSIYKSGFMKKVKLKLSGLLIFLL